MKRSTARLATKLSLLCTDVCGPEPGSLSKADKDEVENMSDVELIGLLVR